MKLLWRGLWVIWIVACIYLFVFLAQGIKQQAYCTCMGRQVYINTRWYEDRCLTNVTDYNDSDTTVLLYDAMEICR